MTDDRVRMGPSIPGWALRAVGVVAVAAALWMLQPVPFWQGLFLVVALVGAVRPSTALTWGALAGIPFALVFAEPDAVRTAVAVLTVHLVHVVGALTQTIPAAARVSLRALLSTVRRFALVQVPAQVLALVAVAVPWAREGGLAWAAPIGAAAVVALVIGGVRMLRADRR